MAACPVRGLNDTPKHKNHFSYKTAKGLSDE